MIELFVLKESRKNYLCSNCGKNGGKNCIYGEYDYYGDFECTHENADNLECPYYETFCKTCYKLYMRKQNDTNK